MIVACLGGRGTDSSNPGRHGVLTYVLLEEVTITPAIEPTAYHRVCKL